MPRTRDPLPHLQQALAQGFINFRSPPIDIAFTYAGHDITAISLNGIVVYTFAHDAEGNLQTVTNERFGETLTFTHNPDGTIAAVASAVAL